MKVDDILKWVTANMSQVQPETAIQWSNEAQNYIAVEYPPVASTTYTPNAITKEFILPNDYLSFVQMRDINDEIYDTSKLKTPIPGFIRFAEEGTFTMYYGKVPTPMSTESTGTDLDIHLLLQPLIFDYLFYKFYDNYADGDKEESDFASKFYDYFTNKLAYLTQKLMETNNVGFAPDDPVPMKVR